MQTEGSHTEDRVVQMAMRTARSVRKKFERSGFNHDSYGVGDCDDVEQDAFLAVFVNAQKPTVDWTQNVAGLCYLIGSAAAGVAASNRLAAVTVAKNRWREAHKYQRRVPFKESHGAVGEDESPSVRQEDALAVARARVRLRRALERHLAQLSDRARRAVELCLGYDGEISDMREAAFRAGLSTTAILNSVRRIAPAIRADKDARAAWEIIKRSEER